MKIKFIFALAISACLLASPAFSQKTIQSSGGFMGRYAQAISVDPFVFLVNKVFNVTYEHRVGADNSLTGFLQYYKPLSYWSGVGLGVSYRWYIDITKEGKKALEGFSVGPLLGFTYWSLDNVLYEDQGWGSGAQLFIGAEVNYKFTFDGWFIEPNIKYSFPLGDLTGLDYTFYGFGVNLGWAW